MFGLPVNMKITAPRPGPFPQTGRELPFVNSFTCDCVAPLEDLILDISLGITNTANVS